MSANERTYRIDRLLTICLRDTTTSEWRVVVYPDERTGGKWIATIERSRSHWVGKGYGLTFKTMKEAVEWAVRDWRIHEARRARLGTWQVRAIRVDHAQQARLRAHPMGCARARSDAAVGKQRVDRLHGSGSMWMDGEGPRGQTERLAQCPSQTTQRIGRSGA